MEKTHSICIKDKLTLSIIIFKLEGEGQNMQKLIKMKNIYLQRKFPSSTEKQIVSFFGLSGDENLLCGIWTSPLFRNGFVITDAALYWFFNTDDGIKTGEIKKESASNIQFEISPHISSENSGTSLANSVAEECSKLEIRSDNRNETFYITGLTEQKGKTFCDILKFGFTQNSLPQIDLGELVKDMPFVPLRNFSDKILNVGDAIEEKFNELKDYLAKGFYEITHIKFVRIRNTEKAEQKSEQKANSTKTDSENDFVSEAKTKETKQDFEKTSKTFESNTDFQKSKNDADSPTSEEKQTPAKKHGATFSFLLNFLDVCASLFFIAGIVVILKPELITEHGFQDTQIQGFGTIAIATYTLLKSIVAFYSKRVYRKILPIILIVVSILAYIMFTYSFGIYQDANKSPIYIPFIAASLIFALLSYFAFEYSCGYRSRTLFKKIIATVILGFIIYVSAQYAIYPRKAELGNAASNFWREISKFCEAW